LKQAHKSAPAALHAVRLMSQFLLHRVRYGRGVRSTNGNALAVRLILSALRAGVDLCSNARALHLNLVDGAVKGVIAERDGERELIRVQRGVVIAAGGFGHDPALRDKHVPHARYGFNLQPEGSRGDGVRMGIEAGGRLQEGNIANGIWQPISVWQQPNGEMSAEIYWFSRLSPGTLIVDAASGRRFVNEGSNYHTFVREMHAKGIQRGWQISDADAARKYGIGLVKPWPFRKNVWIRRGYLREASSIAGLAAQIALDPRQLELTVARFNEHAERGLDPDFHKGESLYSRYLGDPDHKPNPALGPVRTPPFYAVPLCPGETSAAVGLVTNEFAQVLAADDRPIPGLYAAGLDNNTIMRGTYPAAGTSLGPAMTFGYIAARHMLENLDGM
jgi:FAD binding domain